MGGGYAHQTKGTPMALAAEINKMKVEIDALRRSIANLGIQIDTVNEKLVIAAGRSLEVDGALTVTGNTLIEGNLSVPNGSITNAALQNPVSPAAAHSDATNFVITTTMTAVATASIPVPAGFSQALVYAVTEVAGLNSTTTADTIGAGISFNGVVARGYASTQDVAVQGVGSAACGASVLLTGLNGGSVSIAARVRSYGASWAANVWNTANIDAMALFLR